MNVQVPTVVDLANSLPSDWKDVDGASPNKDWLDRFWAMAANGNKHLQPSLPSTLCHSLMATFRRCRNHVCLQLTT